MWGAGDAGSPRLRFEVEQVFGAEREPAAAILGEPYGLHAGVDDQANVYVLDEQSKRLVSFDPSGRVRWRTGREGEGPGELYEPSDIAVRGNGTIAVLNQGRTRIDIWDKHGSYVSSLALTDPPLSLSAIAFPFLGGFVGPDSLVLFGGLRGRSGSRIAVLDLDGPEVDVDFEWNQLPDLEMPWSVSSEAPVRADGGLIVVGSGAGYEFRVYTADGTLRRHVTRAVDYPVRSGFYQDEHGEGISSFGKVFAPMLLDPRYLLVCVTWTAGIDDPDEAAAMHIKALRERRRIPRDSVSSFDLYDREGRFLYSLVEPNAERKWPTTGIPQFVGPDNRLYTIADDPFPQIRRYRVLIR